MHDDVLFGVAAVFAEEIDSADVAGVVFDSDAYRGEIAPVQPEIGNLDSADERFVDVRSGVVDSDFFQHAVLRGICRPIRNGESPFSVAVVSLTAPCAYLFSVNPEGDIRFPSVIVIGAFGAEFQGKSEARDRFVAVFERGNGVFHKPF